MTQMVSHMTYIWEILVPSVVTYNTAYDPVSNIKVASGATAYTDPVTNYTFILWIHEALFFGKYMSHSLINPNQLRIFGVAIQNNPYHATESMSILATTTKDEDLSIPLQSKGVDFFLKAELQIQES